jgi:hypothetical protein
MKSRKTFRTTVTWVAALVLWGAAAQIAEADAFNYYYDDATRFALYGQQDNFTA